METSKDLIREANIDLKHEVRMMINQNKTACTSRIGDDTRGTEADQGSTDSKMKQKEIVLGDIRNLIQEYKREKRTTSARQM